MTDKRPEPTKAYSDMTNEELLFEMETRRFKRDGQVEVILHFAAQRMRVMIGQIEGLYADQESRDR